MFYLRISDDDCVLIGNRDLNIISYHNNYDEPILGELVTASNEYSQGAEYIGGDSSTIFESSYENCLKLLNWILEEGEAKRQENPLFFVLDARKYIESLKRSFRDANINKRLSIVE